MTGVWGTGTVPQFFRDPTRRETALAHFCDQSKTSTTLVSCPFGTHEALALTICNRQCASAVSPRPASINSISLSNERSPH